MTHSNLSRKQDSEPQTFPSSKEDTAWILVVLWPMCRPGPVPPCCEAAAWEILGTILFIWVLTVSQGNRQQAGKKGERGDCAVGELTRAGAWCQASIEKEREPLTAECRERLLCQTDTDDIWSVYTRKGFKAPFAGTVGRD